MCCLFVVLLTACPSFAVAVTDTAVTYYVSPNTGSDTKNTGTSPSSPWASASVATERISAALSDVSAALTSATLLLERDSIFINDPLVIFSTTSVATITVGAYGNASLPRPLLQQARGLTDFAISSCLLISSPSAAALTVENLHFSGCSRGLVIAGHTSPDQNTTNVFLSSNIFADIRTPFLRYTPPNPKWAPAILLIEGNFANMTVKNNIGVRCDVFFQSNAHVIDMDLDSNTVQQCSGNCYSLGAGVGLTIRNSVFLRDMSTRLFSYGTTDVIIGTISGANALINNDFNKRGEYQGGPDGCAFDFETSATGFAVKGNTFSQSWGAGIMVFGHETTSHNIQLDGNVFDRCGCTQNRGDAGAIAIMCPNKHKPSGQLENNTFYTLPGCPAITPGFPGCDSELVKVGNKMIPYDPDPKSPTNAEGGMVVEPQLSFNPPAPSDKALSGLWQILGVTTTPNATIRYTLDGSRPTENSPIMTPFVNGGGGIRLPWPGPAVHVNLRAFKEGMIPSITNGALVELNYGFGRSAPNAGDVGPGGHRVGHLDGLIDGFQVDAGVATVHGWVVDGALPRGGWAPVVVVILVDGEATASVLASLSRPDLVKAGVAPNPDHGFQIDLSNNATRRLMRTGRHVLTVKAVGSPSSGMPVGLPSKSTVVCVDGKCV